MLDYQRVAYFWKHPHVGIVHPRNQLAVVLSVFHDILSSKQRPKVGMGRHGWPQQEHYIWQDNIDVKPKTSGCQNMSKTVTIQLTPDMVDECWLGFPVLLDFSMWEKLFLLRTTWSPGGKPHPMIGNNSWFRTSTTRTFAVSIGTRTTTKVLDVKILIVVSNYNKNVSFTCY